MITGFPGERCNSIFRRGRLETNLIRTMIIVAQFMTDIVWSSGSVKLMNSTCHLTASILCLNCLWIFRFGLNPGKLEREHNVSKRDSILLQIENHIVLNSKINTVLLFVTVLRMLRKADSAQGCQTWVPRCLIKYIEGLPWRTCRKMFGGTYFGRGRFSLIRRIRKN